MRNTRTNATSNKYWENETPIETTTDVASIRYYKEAGKIQLYSMYTDGAGEVKLGKGCVWDNNEMSADDALLLAYGVMRGLLDSGVENSAFADAYNLLQDAIGADTEESETVQEQSDDTEDVVASYYFGKNISYDGSFKKASKKVSDEYVEWADDALEWATYIYEQGEEIRSMPIKTAKQKEAQNKAYANMESEIVEWVESWGNKKMQTKINAIVKPLLFGDMETESAVIEFVKIIDALSF